MLLLAGVLVPASALAAPADPSLQDARQRFAQAEADEDAGRWAEALEKLRTVSEFKLTAGVRYHIALCEEHLGQLARALADYRTAQAQARDETARDVLRLVGKQLAALEPRIPRLTVHVVPETAETVVTVDGAPVAAAALDAPMELDPGLHRIEATAPDRPTGSVTVTLREHDATGIELKLADPLRAALTPPPSAPAPPGSPSAGSPLADGFAAAPATASLSPALRDRGPRIPRHSHTGAAIAATAVTVALGAGGAIAYVLAGQEHDRDVGACGAIPAPAAVCDPYRSRVRALDFTAAGAWAAGLVGAVVSVVLWTASSPSSASTSARLVLAASAARVEGRF